MRQTFVLSATFAVMVAASYPVHAADSLENALKEGTPYIGARYRYEFVNQDGLAKDANASTLRTRVGYKSGSFYDTSFVLEGENVAQAGSAAYNDTINGKTNRPVVADVESTEVNQALLKYEGLPDSAITVGRQVIKVGNQRFVGDVGWRQNNQTFDAITAINKSIPDTQIMYGYVDRVNRIFGTGSPVGDYDAHVHLLNASNSSTPLGTLTGYGYLLDIDDAPSNSSKTFGASLKGKRAINQDFSFLYYAEYAFQSDYGNNTTHYDADYYHIAPALGWKELVFTAGYEVLGSDNGTIGFSTPLATLHKFNGWADKFLTTPANGLKDAYVDLTYKVSRTPKNISWLNGLRVKGQYHDFSADKGGADYGSEWGIYLKKAFKTHYYVETKYANYNADSFATDTQKFTLDIGINY